ncbi:MAG: MATE family efflux transporter [Lachnospiraceae bacterium]
MRKNVDLLHESIMPALTRLAVPIMATSLVQMAYNLTDMLWIGRLGAGAVTAVGTAGLYIWMSQGVIDLARIGGQVKVSQSLGCQDKQEASQFAKGALQIGMVLALLFGMLSLFGAGPLIGFFGLRSQQIILDSMRYLQITGGAIIFSFLNAVLTGILAAEGDSKTSFKVNVVGLISNIVMDPVLIFGLGPFPRMGVEGAAIATVGAQIVVTLLFVIAVRNDKIIFDKFRLFTKTPFRHIKGIVQIGLPAAMQKILMAGISMILTRLVASWGDTAVAVQRVGSQIESISWMTAEGFGVSINSFTGQNYGARQYQRVKSGYLAAVKIMTLWGIFTTAVLIFLSVPIFRVFIAEPEVLAAGSDYLKILGVSQLFMCIEILTIGAFAGLGKTMLSSVISTILMVLRIPLAVVLSATALGLNGIWWSITLSSMLKGILFLGFYMRTLRKLNKEDK